MMEEDAMARLRQRLDEVHEWPTVYMFKMIFEPDDERLRAVLALFPPETEILRKYSKGGRYLSLTVREVMMDAGSVVDRYRRAGEIGGVMML